MEHAKKYQRPSGSVFRPGMLSTLLGITLLIALILPRPLQAAPGDLDPSFGSGGRVYTDFGGDDRAFALSLQPDGKIVVAGTSSVHGSGTGGNFALARYNVDGSLDATFGTGGKVITDFINNGSDEAHVLALQPDGKIVAAGHVAWGFDFALARYNPDGSLDVSFGNGGKVITSDAGYDWFSAVALQPDGKIVVAGWSGGGFYSADFVLARYNFDGTLDAGFGSGGKVTTDLGGDDRASAMALQPDGKIVAAGRTSGGNFALTRYNQDGSPDATFGLGGKVTTDLGGDDAVSAMALQPDGRIVVGGASNSRFALARYNRDGSLDPTFGAGGAVIADFDAAAALALQPDGKIVVAAWPGLARYNPDGRLDLPFGTGGTAATGSGATALALQADGKIVTVGGLGNFLLARYEGGSSEGAPLLRLDLNQSSFVPGETLRAGIAEANYGKEIMVDKYFGALLPPAAGPGLGCPAGDAIVFLTPRMVLTCRSASPQTFEPVARNLLLPAHFPALRTPNFYSIVWPSEAPTGTYTFFIAFTRAGTVDILALATTSASFSAEPPKAPSSLTATAPCRTVTLGWRINGGQNGFRVERRSEGGSFVEIATVAGVAWYQDGGLTPGVVYTYRVRAYRGALNSTYSNEAVVTGGPEPPQAPTNLTATAVSTGIRLAWQDNSNNESGFNIERKVSALFLYTSDWQEIATVGPGVTSYQDRPAPTIVRLTFSYAVRAFNGTCSSGSSTTSVTR
jgi:uncharacterized delta-60 repeat protein